MAKTLHEPCMSECVSVYLLGVAQSEWLHFPESFSAPRLQEATYLHVGHQHRDNHRHEHAIGQAEDHHGQQEGYEGGRCSADAVTQPTQHNGPSEHIHNSPAAAKARQAQDEVALRCSPDPGWTSGGQHGPSTYYGD